ncbi:MAG: hypothetical protein ACRDQ7_11755 [Haloechinothrix sp.]
MKTEPTDLANRLLDAQVEFILTEVSGDRLAEVVARDVDDLLAVAETTVVADLVDREQVKATTYKILDQAGGSVVIEPMVADIADAIYQLTANDEHHLGEVIDRDQVQELVRKVISMRHLHEEVLRRLTESPVVATVASWFVTKLVSDVMQQNREFAERVPGVASLLSVGERAANRVRGATSRHLDQFVGDMAGKGAQLALRRVSTAIRHTMREAPLHDAAMEVWDLHAEDKISGLKNYLNQDDLRELASIGYEIWLILRNTDYFRELLGAGIDVFFDSYGSHQVSALLTELGLSRDDLVTEVQRYAPAVVEALNKDGQLAELIRRRLEPFFHSDTVLRMLAAAR